MKLIPWLNKNEEKVQTTNVPIVQLRDEVDRLFDRFFRNPWSPLDFEAPGWPMSSWMPSLDVSESEEEVTARIEIPGVDPKDLEISVSGNTLTIQGNKKEESEDRQKNYTRVERRFGSFRRTIDLPQQIEEDSLKAKYKNGVLTVTARKVVRGQKKRIPINVMN